MDTTEGWDRHGGLPLMIFKKAGSLVINAVYDLPLVGDVYAEFFFHFLNDLMLLTI